MTYIVSQTVSSKDIADLIVTAFEGGSAYWCQSAYLTKVPDYTPEPDQVNVVQYSHHQVYDGDFLFKVGFDDPEGEEGEGKGRKDIGPAELQAGLNIFATKYPERFGNWLKENYDAEDADVFWQCVVLGDIVYG